MLRGRALRLTSAWLFPDFCLRSLLPLLSRFYQISVFLGRAVPVAAFVVELVARKSAREKKRVCNNNSLRKLQSKTK